MSIPGFINRVDIRETSQEADYRFRPKKGWIVDWGPSLSARYDFDHTGLRLDTDYIPYLAIQGRGQTVIILRPYEELRERLRPQDFCFYGFSLYCRPTTLGNQDYHEHTSGASIQTGYFKRATLSASYYWGQGVNFVAMPPVSPAPPTPYEPSFPGAGRTTPATLTLRPMKPLKIENTYLFERLHSNNRTSLFEAGADSWRGPGHLQRSHSAQQVELAVHSSAFVRLILQYNALLAGTPGVGSPYTYLPTQKQFNADFLVTYLVHPGTAIYIGYNSDLQNLNVEPASACSTRREATSTTAASFS